jgi:hypothetical protein
VPRTDRGRLAALTGFAATAALLVLTVVSLVTNALQPLGWHGLEHVLFFFIALGAALAGPVVKVAAPAPWRSAGSGMVLAGLIGVGIYIALMVTIYWALSHQLQHP